jgi:inositol phosphorylceramide mannosyltransferase catalytic subunit
MSIDTSQSLQDVSLPTEMSSIPRIIHQIWYQGENHLPDRYRFYRETWKGNHPNWQFILWDEVSINNFMTREYPFFEKYFTGYPLNIQRMDAARYFILNTFGGFYIDTDVENLKPIDELLVGHKFIVSETIGYNNAIIGSIPGHPVWESILKRLIQNHERPRSLWFEFYKRSEAYFESVSTGPLFFSRSVQAEGFDKDPDTLVCPGSFFEPDFPRRTDQGIIRSNDHSESYAVHFGDLKWLPPMHRYLSGISNGVFKLYWNLTSKKPKVQRG